jgi:hypothetical protein
MQLRILYGLNIHLMDLTYPLKYVESSFGLVKLSDRPDWYAPVIIAYVLLISLN